MTDIEMKPAYLRSYEISIWTLQDRFISVLKWADIDVKGQIQDDKVRMVDDGTREFTFSIPKFYYLGDTKMDNPLWHSLSEMPLEANMHKLKVLFNKNTEDWHIEEFLVTSVELSHKGDQATFDIKAEGLAFHELGKIGYKIGLAPETYYIDQENWFDNGAQGDMPVNNINYWNDIVFGTSVNNELNELQAGVTEERADEIIEQLDRLGLVIHKQELTVNNNVYTLDLSVPSISSLNINNYYKTNWTYEIRMDWSSFSNEFDRATDKVYEEEYISSWDVSQDKTELLPRSNVRLREKYRMVEISESNIYNITQKIAEVFGVFCRYEYEYDDKYQIIGRKVVYYNNYLMDKQGHLDLTYPYDTSEVTRTIDNTDTITKMYVRMIDDNSNDSNVLSIMDVEANRSMEDYLLNFDYLKKIENLTDEQYESIEPYEAQMREYNQQIITLNNFINAFTNQLNDLYAKYTVYDNAVGLDKDRIEEAKAQLDALTNGDDTIELTGANAKFKTLIKDEKNGWYYIEVPDGMGGLEPVSVKLYKTMDWSDKNERLKDQVFSGEVEYDGYGNAVRINKIYLSGADAELSGLYFICNYKPNTQYENMLRVWGKRLEEDKRLRDELGGYYNDDGTLTKRGKIDNIEWYLYGAKVGYGRVGAAAVDGDNLLAGVVFDSEDGANAWNTVGHSRVAGSYNSSNYDSENGIYHEEFGDDILDETPDLLWNYEKTLKNKAKAFQKFERLMGPAMREGNWQPEDDYINEGDYYYDSIPTHVVNDNQPTNGTQYLTKYLTFKWDDRLFDEETPVIYSASVDTKVEQHLIVDLSNAPLDAMAKYWDKLSFVYYDEDVVRQIWAIENKDITYIDENEQTQTKKQGETEWTKHLKQSMMMRSFRVGSECELGWVIKEENGSISNPIPVLIITGATSLTNNEINYIMGTKSYNEGYSIYQPFIGQFETQIVLEQNGQGGHTEQKYEKMYKIPNTVLENRFISMGVNIRDNIIAPYNTYETYQIRRVYPRLHIDSLKLKLEAKYLKINLNNTLINMYEDFYVVQDERLFNMSNLETGYYVTIKPEALFRYGTKPIEIYIQYVLSNADVSIYLDALEIMRENAFPKATYQVSLALLNKDFIHTLYTKLNHIVNINDYELKLDGVHGYISSVDMSLSKPWEDTIEVKNYETKFEDLFSTIVASSESMKKNENAIINTLRAFTADGTLTEEALVKGMARADLNYSFNQGTLTIDQANGIWATSDDGVVAMRGGGIFTANQKDSSGNWIWNTGILPSGINASLITTGQLDTNRIKIYAGDELRFQLNGDGLYAYKSKVSESDLITDDTPEELRNQIMNEIGTEEDHKQYVVFNKEGLFLTALAGSRALAPVRDGQGNVVGKNYFTVPQDTDRVEISWQGLILRDWNNDKVFYADPDTGNLSLTGEVTANSGKIGGWTLTAYQLSGRGVNLISGPTKDAAGIFLTTQEQLDNKVYDSNGNTYYIYNPVINETIDTNTKYYLQESISGNFTINFSNTDKVVYYQDSGIVSVVPRYQHREITYVANDDNITFDETGDSRDTSTTPYTLSLDQSIVTATTTIYIATNAEYNEFAIDGNGDRIEYDFDTSPTATWYDTVKTYDSTNYRNYIQEIVGIIYKPYEGSGTLTLCQSENKDITFSVNAKDGNTIIRKGILGNFSVDSNALSGGTIASSNIDTSNYFYVGGDSEKQEQFGKLFYDIEADSEAGTFTLKRVNGEEANFNIAAMAAYKRAVAAAATIQLTLSAQGNTIVATARSGGGVVITRSMTVSGYEATDDGGSGGNNGNSGCGACGNSCTGGCRLTCKNDCGKETPCKNTCGTDCNKGCSTTCSNNCQYSCNETCASGCVSGCGSNCTNDCTGGCSGGCTSGCTGGCNTTCTGGCKTTCTGTCSGTCSTTCISGCSGSCLLKVSGTAQ